MTQQKAIYEDKNGGNLFNYIMDHYEIDPEKFVDHFLSAMYRDVSVTTARRPGLRSMLIEKVNEDAPGRTPERSCEHAAFMHLSGYMKSIDEDPSKPRIRDQYHDPETRDDMVYIRDWRRRLLERVFPSIAKRQALKERRAAAAALYGKYMVMWVKALQAVAHMYCDDLAEKKAA